MQRILSEDEDCEDYDDMMEESDEDAYSQSDEDYDDKDEAIPQWYCIIPYILIYLFFHRMSNNVINNKF